MLKLGFDWEFNTICMLATYRSRKPNRVFDLPRADEETVNSILGSSWISKIHESDMLDDVAIKWICHHGKLQDEKCWVFKKRVMNSRQSFVVNKIGVHLTFEYMWNVKEYERGWKITMDPMKR